MTSIKLMKKGFTLVELLVVVAMLAILMGSMGASVSSAQERAREQKALSDVKVISQALLASENYETGGNGLTPMNDAVADANNLKMLLGEGPSAASGGTIPALLSVALSSGKTILDPWGTPYRITIVEKSVQPQFKTANGNLQTGFYLPNFHRLSESER